jgi:branched-chain amino acid transport system permease protein
MTSELAETVDLRSIQADRGRSRGPVALAVVAFLAAALPFVSPIYGITLGTEIMIAGLFASGVNLLLMAGLVSLGQAMFLGMGGYGIAIASTLIGLPLWCSVPATLVCTAILATIIGAICTRTRGVEFLLITLAFSQMAYGAAIKMRVTNGSDGMSGIPRPDLSAIGANADEPATFYLYVLAVTAVSLVALWRITNSPFGSVLIGVRENERRLEALGYAIETYKLGAYVLGAMLCAVAGILQAQYAYFVNPDAMGWQVSGEGVLMVIIGGSTTIFGGFVGAAIFVLVKQWLSLVSENYQMFFGLFFMAVVAFLRGGVLGAFRRRLGARS